MSDDSKTRGGVSFCGMLTIVFIALKLCKVVAWSWVWILSPLWIPLALVIIACVIIGAAK